MTQRLSNVWAEEDIMVEVDLYLTSPVKHVLEVEACRKWYLHYASEYFDPVSYFI